MNLNDASKIGPTQSADSTRAAERIIIVDDEAQVRKAVVYFMQ